MDRQGLNDAARFATCQVLQAAGGSLVGAAVLPIWPAPYRVGALTLGALSVLGAEALCAPIDVGPAKPDQGGGCQEMEEGGWGQLQTSIEDTWGNPSCGSVANRAAVTTKILRVYIDQKSSNLKYQSVAEFEGLLGAGLCRNSGEFDTEAEAAAVKWRILPIEGSCENQDDVPKLPEDAFDDIPYTDPVNNCNYTINLLGFVEEFEGGPPGPAFLIKQAGTLLRADGGVIGGCNFAPTVYYGGSGGSGGGGGGGVPPFPYVPGDGPNGSPNWLNTILGALTGAGGALITNTIIEVLQGAFSTVYPGLIYRMVSVCEKDASGEPISEQVEVPIPSLTAPDAQLARLDAIVELLQASKNFKQPVCPNERPKLEGDWRTISFRSTESSPYGKSCLRKRFRYRSLSGLGLGEVVNYWKDFTWESGGVCVTHKGHSWGTPQVWAATADEGKRVIQHAAGEAGFDANQVGEWGISSSASARYGVSLPMKVDTTGGYYWITERDGSDGRPIVAL